jgi:hypothetical protein
LLPFLLSGGIGRATPIPLLLVGQPARIRLHGALGGPGALVGHGLSSGGGLDIATATALGGSWRARHGGGAGSGRNGGSARETTGCVFDCVAEGPVATLGGEPESPEGDCAREKERERGLAICKTKKCLEGERKGGGFFLRSSDKNVLKAMTTMAMATAMPMMAPVETVKAPLSDPSAPATGPFPCPGEEPPWSAPVFSVSVMVGKLAEPVWVAVDLAVAAGSATATADWDRERRRNKVERMVVDMMGV